MTATDFRVRLLTALRRALPAALLVTVPILLLGDLIFVHVWDAASGEPLSAEARLVITDPKRPEDLPVLVSFNDLARFSATFPGASLAPPANAESGKILAKRFDWIYRYRQRPRADGSIEVTVHRTRDEKDPDGQFIFVERFRYRVADGQPIPEKFVSAGGLIQWLGLVGGLGILVALLWALAELGVWFWERFRPGSRIDLPNLLDPRDSGWLESGIAILAVALNILIWPVLDPLSDDPVNVAAVLVALAISAGCLGIGALRLAISEKAPGLVPVSGTAVSGLRGWRAVSLGVVLVLAPILMSTSHLWQPRLTGKQHWFYVPSNVHDVILDMQTFVTSRQRLPRTLDELPTEAHEHLRKLREDFASVEFAADGTLTLTLHPRTVVSATRWVIPRVVRGDSTYWDWCHTSGLPDEWQPHQCTDMRWVWMEVLDAGIRKELLAHARDAGKARPLDLSNMPALNPASYGRAMLAAAKDAGGGRLQVTLSDHAAVPAALRGRTVTIHAEIDTQQHEWSTQKGRLRLHCAFEDGKAVPRELRPDDCGRTFD